MGHLSMDEFREVLTVLMIGMVNDLGWYAKTNGVAAGQIKQGQRLPGLCRDIHSTFFPVIRGKKYPRCVKIEPIANNRFIGSCPKIG